MDGTAPRRRSAYRRGMRRERGASLVEAVVASVVLSVGIVAVLAVARSTMRLEAQARWSAGTAEAAAAQAGALGADPCTIRNGAGASAGPPAMSWTLGADSALRTVDLTVAYPEGSGRRAALYAAAFLCTGR
jgi:Tfp pilus assembly protein PilV